MQKITTALAEFIQEVGPIIKGSQAQYGKYADLSTVLNVIRPILSKHGLVIIQPFAGQTLETKLLHTSGESISSSVELVRPDYGSNNPLHKWGAAVTYQRRYAILALLGLATEDDDGDSISISTPQLKEVSSENEWGF